MQDAAAMSNGQLYTDISQRAKWFVDRVLRRAGQWMPPLGRIGPVGSVRLRQMQEPLFVRMGTSDWVVLEEIFRWGAYKSVTDQTLGIIRTVIDLGANVGLSVRLWQELFDGVKVIAVEPEPANAKMLHRNIDAGPAPRQVAVIEACVAGSSRRVGLDTSGGSWGVKMTEGQSIPAMTMGEVMIAGGMENGASIDLLKCDIEGAEAEIFADCAAWITRVRWLTIELHPPYNLAKLQADLQRNGGAFTLHNHKDWAGQTMAVLEQIR